MPTFNLEDGLLLYLVAIKQRLIPSMQLLEYQKLYPGI